MTNVDFGITVRRGLDWRALFPYVVAGLVVLWSLGWLLKAAVVAVVCFGVYRAYLWHQARCAEEAAVAARADRQHNLVMSGDERGVFGDSYETHRKCVQ